MSITYMHWQNSFYHKTVGGRAAAIIFFCLGEWTFFVLLGEIHIFFFERFELQNIDEVWWHPLQYIVWSKKYDIYHRHDCSIFLCWKIMWKYFMSFWLQNNVKISGISIVFIQMDSEGRREDEKSFQSLQNLGNFVITIDVILAWTRLNGK